MDEKGFTAGLQELALLAGVLEPYAAGRDELRPRFAGVWVSRAKIERLVGAGRATGAGVLGESRDPVPDCWVTGDLRLLRPVVRPP